MQYPGCEQTSHMVFCQKDNEVQAFAPQRANESLAEGIGLRALWWRFHNSEPKMADAPVELLGEDGIAVMEEEAHGIVQQCQ
jgi:hypothetical protein